MAARVVKNLFYVEEPSLKDTPSRKDGIEEKSEILQRAYICGLIQEVGVLLEYPQVVVATAQVLFHRFFHRASMKKHSHLWAGAAALFLSSKVEEVPTRLRTIITMMHMRFVKNFIRTSDAYQHALASPLEPTGMEFYEWTSEISKMEMFILKELGFVLHVEHPHKFILVYVNTMKDNSKQGNTFAARWKALLQSAWNYANDSMRTDLCVRMEPEIIACGCIRMASKRVKVELPVLESGGWWQIFGATEAQLDQVENEIQALYDSAHEQRFEDLTNRNMVHDIMKTAVRRREGALNAGQEVHKARADSKDEGGAGSPENGPGIKCTN